MDPASLPAGFRERMAALLGAEVEEFLAALAVSATGLRVNPLRIDPEGFRKVAPFPLESLAFPEEGFLVPEEARPGSHPYHAAGLYYLQDPGAMVVGALPPLPPNPRVLDLAAAPGGKATHLAARMAANGILVANDVDASRARELAGNLERCGVTNSIVSSEGVDRLRAAWGGWFDLVLLDAPCSGESMFHKSVVARQEWSPGAVAGCARRQGGLIEEALGLVRPGGMLVYSTCTFSPEENESVVAALLRRHPKLQVVELPAVPGAAPGRSAWTAPEAPDGLERTLRLWPHRAPGAGHFVAALRRPEDPGNSRGWLPDGEGRSAASPLVANSPRGQEPHHRASPAVSTAHPAPGGPVPAPLLQRMAGFMGTSLPGLRLPLQRVVASEDRLYLLPEGSPPLDGVRVLRPGWWLGTDRTGRFDPSHALALGVDPACAAERVELSAAESEVQAYLRGETLHRPGPDGWALVTVDGFGLGWGKRSAGVVKNHYPKGLRRR